MGRAVVRDLDFLGDGVTAGDAGVTRSESRVVDTLALGAAEGVAGEPIVAVASLARGAIAAVVTTLTTNVGAGESASLEAGFGSLLLGDGWDIPRGHQLVDEGLVLADTVGEHASVVTVVVDTPLNVDGVTGGIGDDSHKDRFGQREQR